MYVARLTRGSVMIEIQAIHLVNVGLKRGRYVDFGILMFISNNDSF